MEPKNDQNFWNFVFAVLFIILFVFSLGELKAIHGSIPRSIPLFDLILVMLAVFRLSRLFVYDKITQFIRDLFVQKRFIEARDGSMLVEKTPYKNGPARTVSDLFNCPWCIGVWAAPAVLFFYFMASWAWYVILALAISGVAAFIQLSASAVGWSAEYLKLRSSHEATEQDVANKHC
jgi:hypothetical protein